MAAALLGAAVAASALSNRNDFCTGAPGTIASRKAAAVNLGRDSTSCTVVLRKQLTMSPQAGRALGSLTIRCGTFRRVGDGVIKGAAVGVADSPVVVEAASAVQLTDVSLPGGAAVAGHCQLAGAPAHLFDAAHPGAACGGSGRPDK